jgi:protein-S-isoprenylcysteine O-methyltransferase Ste14
LSLSTALVLQIVMLVAAVGLTQLPWYHVARGRGARVAKRDHYGYLRLMWLPGLLLDLALALNVGRVKLSANMAWGCAGIGLLVFAAATVLGFAAWRALGPARGPALTITEGQTLVTTGPFALARHPGYLANFAQVLGAGLALQNWVILGGALLAFFFWRRVAQDEDKLLLAHFGDEFRAYRRKAPQLIPFTGV